MSKKLTRNDKAKIRYQLYRDSGYSVEQARRLRYGGIDPKGIILEPTTRKTIKRGKYKTVKRTLDVTPTVNKLRKVKNDSVLTQHGFLLHSPKYKGEYNEAVRIVKRRDNMSNDQAYYFIYFMLQSGYSYEHTRRELLSSAEFEKYKKRKRGLQ